MKSLFNVFMPSDIIEELETVLYSGMLVGGKNVKIFEEKLTKYVGGPDVLTTNSYNSATSIVWEIIDIQSGDEVIASPMSCIASNQPLSIKRAKVVWTDIDPYTGSLDPDCVRKNITNKTKAILLCHWGGYPGYIDEIVAIGNEFGIPVVEDAIESFGSEYKGRKIGNCGADFTTFSFQPVRLPTSIDGGGLICKNKSDFEKAKLIRDFGIDRSKFRDELGEISALCDVKIPGFGAAMSEINGLVGQKGMNSLEELLKIQRLNAVKNENSIEFSIDTEKIGLADTLPNYWIYSFLSKNRDQQIKDFRAEGQYASKVHLRNDYYSVFGPFDKTLKGVGKFNDEVISIPTGWKE